MNNKKATMNGMLLLTALLWGSGFAFRKMALTFMTPFLLNSVRFYIGFLFVLVIYIFMTKYDKNKNRKTEISNNTNLYKPISYQVLGGFAAGTVLSVAAACQQFALSFTSAGKAGFITSLYTIFVPIISFFILKRKIKKQVWVGAALAVTGLFLITISSGNQFVMADAFGDSLVLISAILFAVQILIIGHFITHSSALLLSTAQFFSCATFSLIFSLLFEKGNSIAGILSVSGILIYVGIFCIGVAYTLQTLAQKKASPSVAAIILSLESVFAAIFGAIILGERMNGFQISGCLLIFIAVVLAQYEKPSIV
ncbi:MAG: DMT family transporter [Eubacteriales bacterium]